MKSIELLSENMRERIGEFGWYELTDIQEKTIPMVINSTKDLIIESETASGKTEAVFLPILSLIENSDYTKEVKIIYISPLKALINDQFSRIYKLTEEMNIRTTKWHGDVSMYLKKDFLKNPTGILQITPESLEAFMINRPNELERVFSGVEFIIVDEIHSFVGTDRGYHLQSLLHRLKKYYNKVPRLMGLSATVDGINSIKEWMNPDASNVELIKAEVSNKKTYYSIMHTEKTDKPVSDYIINDILALTDNKKALIFCNERATVEYLTVKLNEKIEFQKFYAHHSYIDKALRENIEILIKEEESISIVSTSTLELGIDIGSVDLVIQLDCTFTVSSLKQRVGRTGRRKEQNRITQIYTTTPESLLLAIASVELMKEGKVEKPYMTFQNHDYLFQQLLSIIVERNGMEVEALIKEVNVNPVFNKIDNKDIVVLIKYMISNEYLSLMDGSSELILGYKGEKIVHNKDFYAMFESTDPFTVIYDSKKIGLYDEPSKPGQLVMLSGRSWIVISVEEKTKKIYVEPFKEYKMPRFISSAGKRDELVREKVFDILRLNYQPKYLNMLGLNIIKDYSKYYLDVEIHDNERLCYIENDTLICNLFCSDRILRTLMLLFLYNNEKSCFEERMLGNLIFNKCFNINRFAEIIDIKDEFYDYLSDSIFKVHLGKYYDYLPLELKTKIFIEREMDIAGAKSYIKNVRLVSLN